jgi:hypothetical protein
MASFSTSTNVYILILVDLLYLELHYNLQPSEIDLRKQ